MDMISYVTYDHDGNLTGAYIQEMQPEHADAYIEVDDHIRMWWPMYHANAARDGVELAPAPPPVDTEDPPGVAI